jgi:hypothetical protein
MTDGDNPDVRFGSSFSIETAIMSPGSAPSM